MCGGEAAEKCSEVALGMFDDVADPAAAGSFDRIWDARGARNGAMLPCSPSQQIPHCEG